MLIALFAIFNSCAITQSDITRQSLKKGNVGGQMNLNNDNTSTTGNGKSRRPNPYENLDNSYYGWSNFHRTMKGDRRTNTANDISNC